MNDRQVAEFLGVSALATVRRWRLLQRERPRFLKLVLRANTKFRAVTELLAKACIAQRLVAGISQWSAEAGAEV